MSDPASPPVPAPPSATPTLAPHHVSLFHDVFGWGQKEIDALLADASMVKALPLLTPELVGAVKKFLPASVPAGTASVASLATPAQWQAFILALQPLATALVLLFAAAVQSFFASVTHQGEQAVKPAPAVPPATPATPSS